jgi:PPOX class probable F420-dependent enzyme
MSSMSKSRRDAFLKETRIATLATLNEDGSPNALPLWYEWDGDKVRMFSSRDAGKVTRLARDPRACLSIADPVGAPEAWVTVEGTVEISGRGGRELACRLAALYYAPEKARKTIAVWEKKEDWVLLELTPTRILSYG